jgi:hypothetical protein
MAQGTLVQLVLSLVLTLAFSALLSTQKPYLTSQENRYAQLCNGLVAAVIFFAILLEVDTWNTQMEGLANDPGLKMRLQGYDSDMLAHSLIAVVCCAFMAWAWFLHADVIAAQNEQVLRFNDGTLVFLPKPKDAKSFHLFLAHSRQDGGDQVANIKRELEKHCSTIEIFTDIAAGRKESGLDSVGSLEELVENTNVTLCFLTKTFFTRQW